MSRVLIFHLYKVYPYVTPKWDWMWDQFSHQEARFEIDSSIDLGTKCKIIVMAACIGIPCIHTAQVICTAALWRRSAVVFWILVCASTCKMLLKYQRRSPPSTCMDWFYLVEKEIQQENKEKGLLLGKAARQLHHVLLEATTTTSFQGCE